MPIFVSSSPSMPLLSHYKTLPIRTLTVSPICLSIPSPRPAAVAATTTKRRKGIKSIGHRFAAQLADFAPAASAVYGTLLLGGGLFAYSRSGSKGSLLGGISGAILMGTAYLLMQAPETKDAGDALGFGSAFIFASIFGIRLAATRKLIPAGALLGISIFVLAVFVSAYL